MISFISQLFPLWAILLSAVAYTFPENFTGLKHLIVPLLIVIMFGMGATLTLADFRRVLSLKKVVALGVALQYLVMPVAAYAISLLLALPTELMVGMVLVGCTSGGTASNVICYLAKGDVALSISLTMVSTLLAVIALPTLTWLYVGEMVPVDIGSMLYSVAKIVLLPVIAGLIVNSLWGKSIAAITDLMPLISIAAIVLVIAIIVALNQERLAIVGGVVIVGVAAHNALGLLAGYGGAKLLGYPNVICRTLAIEVGMQNSGLAVALAIKYFSPAAALPGAIFSIWHNLTGSALATLWNLSDSDGVQANDEKRLDNH